MKISIFGTGYVGLVTGACLANLGHDILCVDVDEAKIAKLNEGEIPFYEPGVKELVIKNREKKRLRFTIDAQAGATFGDVIFNCVGTPSNEQGAADLKYVFEVAKTVAKHAEWNKILINKSTVPPGTARRCQAIIKETNPNSEVEVVSNPEFLREGAAVYDFTHPDKIVVGAKNDKAYSILRRVYTGRIRTYIPVLETDWETAEMIKYANNSFLATKISFINEIANICDKVKADVRIVAQAMGLDYRISPKFLNPGVGYGGSCFPKDVRALINSAREKNYEAKLLQEVDALNERQKSILLTRIKEKFGDDLNGKTFSVWGLAFKPKTSDIREAPALVLIKELLEQGVKVNAYDPAAFEEVKSVLGEQINYCSSLSESVKDCSAIILITEWDEFRNINFAEIGAGMTEQVIFDGRNIYEPELVKEEGFDYFGIGRR